MFQRPELWGLRSTPWKAGYVTRLYRAEGAASGLSYWLGLRRYKKPGVSNA